MKSKQKPWKWIRGEVTLAEEHMDLRFGDIRKEDDWSKWALVARVSAPVTQVFRVEFLIQGKTSVEAEMIRAVEEQLTFYLVEKGEEDPWAYAQYHCGTGANVYSNVHWSFFPRGFATGSKSRPS